MIGVLAEKLAGEKRVAISPDVVKKYVRASLEVSIEKGAGLNAGYTDSQFEEAGAKLVSHQEAASQALVLKVLPPTDEEVKAFQEGQVLVSLLEPYTRHDLLTKLAEQKVNAIALEAIPRTSRAQSMDVLSSQANIAGYRAVIEAASHYGRFFPLMMTSAGSAKAAKVLILGAGVAGLQAIATARRLGAKVEAFDIRPEVREQIESLGAKFLDLQVGEEGTGTGGYAKELSEEGKARQQAALQEALTDFDIVITTANIPGRKAPVLVTEQAVQGMRQGSVIIDMAAGDGGNCPLSEADAVVEKFGVTLVGHTNYPNMLPGDASNFFARNIYSLVDILLEREAEKPVIKLSLEDDIIDGALVVLDGEVRFSN